METLEELVKRIDDNLEEGWVKLKEIPKRCVLNIFHGPENVPGYLITVYYTESVDVEYIFISDVENKHEFHHAPSLFKTCCFRDRCRWVYLDEVEIEDYNVFYI